MPSFLSNLFQRLVIVATPSMDSIPSKHRHNVPLRSQFQTTDSTIGSSCERRTVLRNICLFDRATLPQSTLTLATTRSRTRLGRRGEATTRASAAKHGTSNVTENLYSFRKTTTTSMATPSSFTRNPTGTSQPHPSLHLSFERTTWQIGRDGTNGFFWPAAKRLPTDCVHAILLE